ncbi:MAG TPA: LamG-like jellyroll fold domain-containing protein [Vicinamibacterales bacterium]|nr:LamG-like jellyroll fold domain-containing protein [Vicinamibacterales bacterium]
MPLGLAAQPPSQFLILPGCYVPPPPPANDGFPVAVTDSLQTVASPVSFTGATLLANDTGAPPLTLVSVSATSSAGGTITGSGPYTYTPASGFVGNDTFTYQIQNPLGTSVGVVNVAVLADQIAPSVALTAPTGGTVSGNVPVVAAASDNVGVAGVKFFDGATQIGAEVTVAPYQVTWNTSAVANGSHSLTAIARDAAGNSATSAAVTVTVSNVALTAPTVDKIIFSEGAGKRTTAAFSTTKANDVLVAFVASDGPAAANAQTVTVTGAGLTWTRVRRQAGSFGDAEIWTATASGLLTNVTVSSTQTSSAHQSLTVIAFSGSSGVGASAGASATTGAASVSLATTAINSLVYATGNDWDGATARTMAAGQTKVHEFVDSAVGDTFWVQATSSAVAAANTTVAMSTTGPTLDQWNIAAVEIKAGVPPPPPPQVTVPNVVGLTQSAAQTAITNAGLTVGTITTANSASVPAGSVISSNPTGGSSAAAGSAVALSVSLGAAPPPPPAAGPVLTMSFNEPSGNTANDSSGNGNNGTIAGATRVSGQVGFGGALSFDGVSSIVNIPHSASLALSSGMTLEAWVNPSADAGSGPNGGWRTVIMKERGTTGLAYALYGNDGDSNPSRPAGYIRNANTDKEAAAGPAVPVGVWTHLAVTYDGTSIRLYVNGVLRSTTGSAGGGIAASTAPLRIGGNTVFSIPGTEYFAGLIDEVRIYNRALSAAEITADMNTPLP